ncbi:hypothetical protein TOPH_08812 [Tolypocladium ophioglossoides CBS 100239]|uniref:Uncharacterized protein n=1 Tax=Tolypocladium ophioglossoides (strain CBS 100239) TaxID=1163406 RepID=A0A0L0MXR7_TOLOC|nr:hypothetical protein TOPH_08812 [Tolypocladium ophioglossoides CBS 100239]
MAPWRFPGWPSLAQAGARAVGWLTDLVTIVVMSYIAQRWPDARGDVAPGILGAAIALLTDSWQAVALADRTLGFPPMPTGRAMAHDMFALGVSLGGLVSVLVLGLRGAEDEWDDGQSVRHGVHGGDRRRFARGTMVIVAVWSLAGVVVWRMLFGMLACWDFHKKFQTAQRRTRTRERR